jgi:hypothetical protein
MITTPNINLEIQADRLENFCPIVLMQLLDLPRPLSRFPTGPARRALILNLRNRGLLPQLNAPIPVNRAWLVTSCLHLRQLALSVSTYVAAPILRRCIDTEVLIPWYRLLGSSLYKQAVTRKDWIVINCNETPSLSTHNDNSADTLTRWGAGYLRALVPADRQDLLARLNLRLPVLAQDPVPALSMEQTQALEAWIEEQSQFAAHTRWAP